MTTSGKPNRGGGGNTAQPGNMAMNPEIWRHIFDAIDAPIFLHDSEFRLLLANRAYCHEAGVSEAEALGKPYWEVFPPGTGPSPGCKETIGKGHASTQEEVSAGAKLFLSTGYAVRDGQGKLLYSLHILGDVTEQREVETCLRDSEAQLRASTEYARDAIITIDGEGGRITAWNLAAEAIFGYSREEMIGRVLHDILAPPSLREAAQAGMAHFAATGEGAVVGKMLELMALHKNGKEFPIELSISAMQVNGKWRANGIVRDISERKQAELHLARLNRMYRTINLCNETLVRSGNELELAWETCRVLVEQGGFRLARVSYAGGDPEKRLTRVAWAGAGEDFYPADVRLTWADTDMGQVPVARAIRSGTPQVCHDIAVDPAFAPWREAALANGYASNIGLPLVNGGGVLGGLSIYSAVTNTFDEEETALLLEMANDLAFGIGSLRARAERMGILEKLEHSLDHAVTAIAATVEMRDPYTAG